MTAEKCPNCGAALTDNVNKCTYCGTVLSNAPASAWTKVKIHLPPPSSSDPNKSIPVLVTNCIDGIYLKFKDGSLWDVYEHMGAIAAYFDFNSNIWHNDLLGKRYGKIIPTHWLMLPDINCVDWISVKERLPSIEGELKGFSIQILVCDKKISTYYESIITARMSFGRGIWDAKLLADDPNSDTCNEVTSTHWMTLPKGPKE
jgi:hypothetical protein